jgi:photosystem II stability/assembly factor-like uncharacterized protein
VNTSTCWATGDLATILTTTNGGSNWSPQASNAGNNNLYGPSCPSVNHCWAVGLRGTIDAYSSI